MDRSFNNIPITASTTLNIVCFDEVYNIYAITEETTGDIEKYELTINSSLSATTDGEYYISLLGNSISNVILPTNAKGQYFYIKSGSTTSTAVSIANALRSCPNINASFTITFDNNKVELTARNYGNLDETLQTNISNTDMTVSHTAATVSNAIVNSDVNAEIYNENMIYLTTLSKTFIKDDIAYNISPVLSTFSEYGKMKQYYLESYYVGNDGGWTPIDNFYCWHTKGYKTPYSDDYISGGTKILIAHPDNYKLWTYGNIIDYSIFTGFGVGGFILTITCYASDETVLHTDQDTIRPISGGAEYRHFNYQIPQQHYNDVAKVTIEAGNDIVTFDIIKPLKMTDGYTRVEWFNEYGGISYFDFTGEKSDTITSNKSDYTKNIYDYYASNEYEEEKVYKIDKTTEYTLNSHIVTENSLFILQSMLSAKNVWVTNEDGSKTHIIITSNAQNKESNYNTAYRIQIKYKKSFDNEK